ncbi:MAG: hypothetical protein ACRDWH_00335 [Acidimicrobiia bacterium]
MNQTTTSTRLSTITGAALLVVLAACAPAATATTPTTTAPAVSTTVATSVSLADPTAAVDLATRFVAAYAANDADTMALYLTAEALSEFGGSVEAMRLEFRFNEAQTFKHMFDSCEVQETSPSGTTVRCPYAYHGIRSDEMGLGPYTGSWYDLVILDGRIVSVEDHIVFLQNGFDAQVWGPFADWVTETYPEDVAVMYTPGQTNVRITEESVALWEQRSREFVAVVNSSAG